MPVQKTRFKKVSSKRRKDIRNNKEFRNAGGLSAAHKIVRESIKNRLTIPDEIPDYLISGITIFGSDIDLENGALDAYTIINHLYDRYTTECRMVEEFMNIREDTCPVLVLNTLVFFILECYNVHAWDNVFIDSDGDLCYSDVYGSEGICRLTDYESYKKTNPDLYASIMHLLGIYHLNLIPYTNACQAYWMAEGDPYMTDKDENGKTFYPNRQAMGLLNRDHKKTIKILSEYENYIIPDKIRNEYPELAKINDRFPFLLSKIHSSDITEKMMDQYEAGCEDAGEAFMIISIEDTYDILNGVHEMIMNGEGYACFYDKSKVGDENYVKYFEELYDGFHYLGGLRDESKQNNSSIRR